MTRQSYPKLAYDAADSRSIATVANSLRDGKVNSIGEFTIPAAHDTETPFTVSDPYVTPESYVNTQPLDEGGANAQCLIANQQVGSFDVYLDWKPLQERFASGGMFLDTPYVALGVGLINFDTAMPSYNMAIDTVANTLTVQRDGTYMASTAFYCLGSNNANLTLQIRINTVVSYEIDFEFRQQTGLQGFSFSVLSDLNVGEVVDFYIGFQSGAVTIEEASLSLVMVNPEYIEVDRTYRYVVLG